MTGKELKNSILQLAISGKLIPQDPTDEPASELLKRIRKEKEKLVKEGKLKKKDLLSEPISDDEKPFDIPENWEWCRLGDISTYTATKKKINASEADLSLWGLDLEDIEKGGRLINKMSVGDRKAIGDKTFFQKGDILYSKLRPYLLKILVAPDNGICTPEIIPFNCYGLINHFFMVALLKSSYVDDYINSVTFGIKMPRVSTETMVNLYVPLPPLAEQHRIVAKIEELMPLIDEYDNAQTELDKLNATLPEALKKSVLQQAICGRLVPQDPTDEPASELLKRIRKEKEKLVKEGKFKKKDLLSEPISDDEKPFDIPECWEWVRFRNIAFNRDSERIPLSVNERSTLAKMYDYYGASGIIDKVENYLFDKPLLLIGEDGANLINRSKPIAFIARGKYWVNNHAHILDFIDEGFMTYICTYINAISLVDYVTGTAQPKMNQEKMNSIPIALPPLAEQHRIVAKIEKIFAEIDELTK